MSKRQPEILIADIHDSANKILTYTARMSFEEFMKDDRTLDAVIRNFEIIGEAANRIPENFKNQYPEIDWHKIRGFRNRIVHDYMGIDYSIVWEIKNKFLPELIKKLKQI